MALTLIQTIGAVVGIGTGTVGIGWQTSQWIDDQHSQLATKEQMQEVEHVAMGNLYGFKTKVLRNDRKRINKELRREESIPNTSNQFNQKTIDYLKQDLQDVQDELEDLKNIRNKYPVIK